MAYRSYTPAEYRKAGINAGPYALEPNGRYRTARRKPILGVVMHITAGLTDYNPPDASADGTSKYGATTSRDASWHVTIDSDSIIPGIRDSYCAWHAGVADIPNVNDATLGIEQGTSQVNWNAAPKWWVEATLRNVAVWLAPRVVKYGIPLTVVRDRNTLDRAIRAGKKFGFVAHATVAPHNRVDPGLYRGKDTYPWERLFALIREEIAALNGTSKPTAPAPAPAPTQEEDDMPTVQELWGYKTNVKGPNGKPIDALQMLADARTNAINAKSLAQQVTADVVALEAAVEALTKGTPIDLDAVKAAARAGVAEAIDDIEVKVVHTPPAQP